MKRIVAVLGLLLAAVLAALGCGPNAFAVGRVLLFGWFSFLRRTVPQVEVNWIGVASGAVFVALLVVLVDRCGRWFCRGMPAEPVRRWRFRWTLSIVLTVLLMFVVAYATIGLARHIGWILSSDDPVFGVEVSER
jgi:hypothetical protein